MSKQMIHRTEPVFDALLQQIQQALQAKLHEWVQQLPDKNTIQQTEI